MTEERSPFGKNKGVSTEWPVTWVGGNQDRKEGPKRPESSEPSLVSIPMTEEPWGWAGLAKHRHHIYKRPKGVASRKKSQNQAGTDRHIGPGRWGGSSGNRVTPALRPPNAASKQLPFRDASPRRTGARWWPTRHRAAKSVPSPAPWAILATHASIQTLDLQSSRPGHLSCPQSTVAIASRESPCLLPRGAGGGGGHLPRAEQVGLTGTRRRRKRRRKGRSVKTLGGVHSHSLGRLSARNKHLRRG